MTLRVAVFGASGRMGQAQVHHLSQQELVTVAVTRNAAVFERTRLKNVAVMPAD
jgi:uncharacterized protein YbjT (DUF2867 family)